MEDTSLHKQKITAERCRRSTGTERAWFSTREEAVRFAQDPKNVHYHGDVAHLCQNCGVYHLSHPSCLELQLTNSDVQLLEDTDVAMKPATNYGEFLRNQREYRRRGFACLSREQEEAAWLERQKYLRSEIVRLLASEFVSRIDACPECSGAELPARHTWPSFFFCDCGRATACCRWLPDEIERIAVL